MTIWTTTDRDNVQEAIRDLATGARLVTKVIGGKEHDYHQTSLPALRALLADINADLAAASAISGARRSSTTVKSDTW